MWKAEVSTGDPERYDTNGLLFEDRETAEAYAYDLATRWTLVRDWRIREATAEEISSGAVYRLEGGTFVRVESATA